MSRRRRSGTSGADLAAGPAVLTAAALLTVLLVLAAEGQAYAGLTGDTRESASGHAAGSRAGSTTDLRGTGTPRPAPRASRESQTPGATTDTATDSPDTEDGPTGVEAAFQATISVPAVAPDGRDARGLPTSYASGNLTDDDPSTCWRMPGGARSALTLTFPEPETVRSVGLVNGYAKRYPSTGDDRYQQERRVLHVTWVFDDGQRVGQDLTDGDRTLQTLSLSSGTTTQTLRLELDDTTAPGDQRFDYTALSELNVRADAHGGENHE